jgi:hypothetical protein
MNYKPLLKAAPSPIVCRERKDQPQPDKLPGLSCLERPAIQTPLDAGPSFRLRGHSAVALRILRGSISRPRDAVSQLPSCALRDLRQPRIAAHLRRTRAGRNRAARTDPRAPSPPLRALPAQVFFRAAAAPRRAFGSNRAKQVALGRIRAMRISPSMKFTQRPWSIQQHQIKRAAHSVAAPIGGTL